MKTSLQVSQVLYLFVNEWMDQMIKFHWKVHLSIWPPSHLGSFWAMASKSGVGQQINGQLPLSLALTHKQLLLGQGHIVCQLWQELFTSPWAITSLQPQLFAFSISPRISPAILAPVELCWHFLSQDESAFYDNFVSNVMWQGSVLWCSSGSVSPDIWSTLASFPIFSWGSAPIEDAASLTGPLSSHFLARRRKRLNLNFSFLLLLHESCLLLPTCRMLHSQPTTSNNHHLLSSPLPTPFRRLLPWWSKAKRLCEEDSSQSERAGPKLW